MFRPDRPLAVDLFCGAGGASAGLVRAGFDVIGVDLRTMPRYPYRFVRGDALEQGDLIACADFVWASPPCQRWTPHVHQRGTVERYEDLIEPVRAMLVAAGVPFCIENVARAPLRTTLILTGDMFGLRTYRKRRFETSFILLAPPPGRPFGPETRADAVTVSGGSGGTSRRDGWRNGTKNDWQEAMGIDWMTNAELTQAVAPAYAEFIGRAAIGSVGLDAGRA